MANTMNDELAQGVGQEQAVHAVVNAYDAKHGTYAEDPADKAREANGAAARKPMSPADKSPFGSMK